MVKVLIERQVKRENYSKLMEYLKDLRFCLTETWFGKYSLIASCEDRLSWSSEFQ